MSKLTDFYSIEKIAKLMADKVGHGMTEKCMKHAEVIFDVIKAVEKSTAENCISIIMSSAGPIDSIGSITDEFNVGK